MLDIKFSILQLYAKQSINRFCQCSQWSKPHNTVSEFFRQQIDCYAACLITEISFSSNRNIANNNFNGWIPQEFSSIPDLTYEILLLPFLFGNHLWHTLMTCCNYNHRLGGNSFTNGPAPPPPPFMPPPPRRPRNRPSHPRGSGDAPEGSVSSAGQGDKKQGLQTGPLVGIVAGSTVGALCALLLLVFCIRNAQKRKDDTSSNSKDFVGPLSVNIERGTTLVHMLSWFLIAIFFLSLIIYNFN